MSALRQIVETDEEGRAKLSIPIGEPHRRVDVTISWRFHEDEPAPRPASTAEARDAGWPAEFSDESPGGLAEHPFDCGDEGAIPGSGATAR